MLFKNINMKAFHFLITSKWVWFIALSFYVIALLYGCKSITKTQSSNHELNTASTTDSSFTKEYHYTDTTKTDESTEVTEYTLTIDSIEYDHMPNIGWSTGLYPIGTGSRNTALGPGKIKGITLKGSTKKTSKSVKNGISYSYKEHQTRIIKNTYQVITKTDTTIKKKAHPIKLMFGILLIAGIVVLVFIGLKKHLLFLFVCPFMACIGTDFATYGHVHHSMEQTDSIVCRGKVIFRVFSCVCSFPNGNHCAKVELFPNPAVHPELREYLRPPYDLITVNNKP